MSVSRAISKLYTRIFWKNYPSTDTALNDINLNKMDKAINDLDDRILAQDSMKLDLSVANGMVKSVDLTSGILTVELLDGSKTTYNTKLDKLAINFAYNKATQQIEITLEDGTVQYIDISDFVTNNEFLNSDTISFDVVNGVVKAEIISGSVTLGMLEATVMTTINKAVADAEGYANSAYDSEQNADYEAKLAKSYAIGDESVRQGSDTDNAKYYMDQAKAVSKVDVATTTTPGIVKPDGTTITVDEDGTIHSEATGSVSSEEDSESISAEEPSLLADRVAQNENDIAELKKLKIKEEVFTIQDSTLSANSITVIRQAFTVPSGYKVGVAMATCGNNNVIAGIRNLASNALNANFYNASANAITGGIQIKLLYYPQ